MRVVDAAGTPIAGARVRVVATYRRCGPSAMPEGCGSLGDESPPVNTDANGTAVVCDVAAAADRQAATAAPIVFRGSGRDVVIQPMRQGRADGTIIVEYADWPTARVPFERAAQITIGPARTSIVELPAGCSDISHVHVSAYTTDASAMVHASPLAGGLRTKRYKLDGLGPWDYWVSSRDDRSGNSAREAEACSTFVRFIDARRPPWSLVLDHSDAVVEFSAFAGGTATVRAFRSDAIVVAATLDETGRATLALPTSPGTAYCLRLEKDDQCRITYARAGEIAKPELYADRERSIEASCGRCD